MQVTSTQSFTVTPGDEATNEVSTSAIDNTGRHAYAVSGLTAGDDYEVALVQAEDVTNTDGTISFSAVDLATGTSTSIELVNGSATGSPATTGTAGSDQETVTADANGEITFTVDSTEADEVIPVVWADADSGGDLDLNADGTPSEDFGIGGQKNWIPAEAPQGTPSGNVTVQSTNLGADYFVGNDGTDDFTYRYDDNDTYRFGGVAISMAQFEGLLTADDVIDMATSSYEPDTADTSVFNVTTDDVPAATDVEGTASESSTDIWDVTVTWTASEQADVTYTVTKMVDGVGPETVATGLTTTSVVDDDVVDAAGPGHVYTVTAEGGTSGSSTASAASDPVVVPTPDATVALLTDGAIVDTDADDDDEATSGDTLVMYFDDTPVVDPAAALQVSNGGNTAVIENGVNGTFSVSGSVVTITLTSDVADAGTTLAYPLAIDDVAGIESVDGVVADVTADEGGAGTGDGFEDNGAEVIDETYDLTDADADDLYTFVLETNEALDAASGIENEALWNYTNAADADADLLTNPVIDTVTLSADGQTITLVIDGSAEAPAAGDSVTFANAVDDDGQTSTISGTAA